MPNYNVTITRATTYRVNDAQNFMEAIDLALRGNGTEIESEIIPVSDDDVTEVPRDA